MMRNPTEQSTRSTGIAAYLDDPAVAHPAFDVPEDEEDAVFDAYEDDGPRVAAMSRGARPKWDRRHRKKRGRAEDAPSAGEAPDDAEPEAATSVGMVCKKGLGRYWVQRDDGAMVSCAISSLLRKRLIFPIADPTSLRRRVMEVKDIQQVDPVAIGDRVRFTATGADEGLITEVLPRRSKLVRRAAGFKPLEQVVVANVDRMVAIVSAAQPVPNWELLDRQLVAAERLDLPALIVVTKLDLVALESLAPVVDDFRRIGYPVLFTSVVSGAGVTAVAAALAGRLSVLVGLSGVGKSSLLNAIEPGLGLRVGEVSRATNKGKHTTTHIELFPLTGGGSLVDTPGMREFGLWDARGAELATAFPEMRAHVGRCRYGHTCRHTQEEGCAILAAMARGEVGERRYQSYLRMRGRDGAIGKSHD